MNIKFLMLIIGMMVVLGTVVYFQTTFSNNASPNDLKYDYGPDGLKVNFIELREIQNNTQPQLEGKSVTKVNDSFDYAIVSGIENRDNVEKTFVYSISYGTSDATFESLTSTETIDPYGTLLIDAGWGKIEPGTYDVEIFLSVKDSVGLDDDGESFFGILHLEEQ